MFTIYTITITTTTKRHVIQATVHEYKNCHKNQIGKCSMWRIYAIRYSHTQHNTRDVELNHCVKINNKIVFQHLRPHNIYIIMNVDYITIEFLTSIAHELPHLLAANRITLLKHSLIGLQRQNQFTNVYFWGRIDGLDKNYYIAFGYTDDCLCKRCYFYSHDCVEWFLLETWHKWEQIDNTFVWDMLQGDVSFVHRMKMVCI